MIINPSASSGPIGWKKILAVVLGLVLLAGVAYLVLWLKPEVRSNVPLVGVQNGASTVTGELSGTFEVMGYLVIKDFPLDWDVFDYNPSICGSKEEKCDSVKYAYLKVVGANNPRIFDFINESKGNSFISEDGGIGLGCYYGNEKRVYSYNDSDEGRFENIIIGKDFDKLNLSGPNNLIKIQLSRKTLSGGGEAICYSHFRDFKFIEPE